MSIKVGDLHLAITAPGGTEAESTLKRVDKAAGNTARTVTDSMARMGRASRATGRDFDRNITKRLREIDREATQVERNMQRLERQRARRQQTTQRTFARAGRGIGQLAGLPVEGFLPVVAVLAGVKVLNSLTEAADNARKATQQLRGAALDLGVPFAAMVQRSNEIRAQFKTTREEATSLATATAKLEKHSKLAGSAQDVLAAAMTTAKARGEDTAAATALVSSAVEGNADAIEALTGLKPDELYDRYAKRVGRAGKELNDMGKAMALSNGIMERGAELVTAAAAAFDPLTDAQQRSSQAFSDLKEQIGESLTPMRTSLHNFSADLFIWYSETMKWADGVESSLTRLEQRIRSSSVFSALMSGLSFAVPGATSLIAKPPAPDTGWNGTGGGSSWGGNAKTPPPGAFGEDTKKAKDGTDALIASLITLRETQQLRTADMLKIMSLAEQEQRVLNAATTSVERRAKAEERLQQLEKAGYMLRSKPFEVDRGGQSSSLEIDPSTGLAKVDAMKPITVPIIPEIIPSEWELQLATAFESVQGLFTTFSSDVADVLVGTLSSGFTGGFKSAKDTLLSGLGSIFTTIGMHLIKYGAVMKGLLPALSNPFTSGFAAIAAGAALVALGGVLGKAALGGGGGSASFTGGGIGGLSIGGTDASSPIRYTFGDRPVARANGSASAPQQSIVVNQTLIGANDPVLQRQLADTWKHMQRRGLV